MRSVGMGLLFTKGRFSTSSYFIKRQRKKVMRLKLIGF